MPRRFRAALSVLNRSVPRLAIAALFITPISSPAQAAADCPLCTASQDATADADATHADAAADKAADGKAHAPTPLPYPVFLDVHAVYELTQKHTVGEDLILLDARSGNDYATAHLPGAINLPPQTLRTPKAKPNAGYSQYLFRIGDDYENGPLDVDRYAAILGGAGIDSTDTVVVYGNHAGKEDGSVPAMILDLLGHQGNVHFFDGRGLEQWQAAGFPVTANATTLPPTDYHAHPKPNALWNLADVQAHLGSDQIVFYDTRSLPEFTGDNKRSNARGGRIPGSIRIDYADLMDADKNTLAAERIAKLHADAGLTPDKTLVLYCQTSTRISLPWLALRQLGYDNLAVYDASMHEYLNRDDTVIATGE